MMSRRMFFCHFLYPLFLSELSMMTIQPDFTYYKMLSVEGPEPKQHNWPKPQCWLWGSEASGPLFGCASIITPNTPQSDGTLHLQPNAHFSSPMSGCVLSMPQNRLWDLLYPHSYNPIFYSLEPLSDPPFSSSPAPPCSLEPHHSHLHYCNGPSASCWPPCCQSCPAPVCRAQATRPLLT